MDFECLDEKNEQPVNTANLSEKFWPGLEEWITSTTWEVENE